MVQLRTTQGDYIVEVERVDPDAVQPISCNYILLDDGGRAVPGVQGSVKHIYGADLDYLTHEPSRWWNRNVSFVDEDRDGLISAGANRT